MIEDWAAEAFNQVPHSANQIHGDALAQRYGFRGGLVPGVTVSAYLMHPAVTAWGRDFLDRGVAHVRVESPLYDREHFEVRIVEAEHAAYRAELIRPDGTRSATAEVSLPEAPGPAPVRRGDPVADAGFQGPPATAEHWRRLREAGCTALRFEWTTAHEMGRYLRDAAAMPALLAGEAAFANPSWILGLSNWTLAANGHMNPWVHLETTSHHHRAIGPGCTVVAEMAVRDEFERRGHHFVDVRVTLFDEADDAALASIDLRAIYRLRDS